MPLLWTHLSLIRDFTVVVKCLFIDDVQHDLGIHITTCGTGAGVCISIVGRSLEIGNGINGVTVEDRITAFIEQPETVEEFIDVA